MTLRDLINFFRFAPLVWRMTGKNAPTRQAWLAKCSDADLQWMADQPTDGHQNVGTQMVLLARRERIERETKEAQ